MKAELKQRNASLNLKSFETSWWIGWGAFHDINEKEEIMRRGTVLKWNWTKTKKFDKNFIKIMFIKNSGNYKEV